MPSLPAEPGAVAHRASAAWTAEPERGSRLLLRLMVFLSLRLGRPFARFILYFIAAYFFAFAPRARRSALLYLQRALGFRPRARDRFRQVFCFAAIILDRLFLVAGRYPLFDISVSGEALMSAQLRSGAGAFLIGAHFGSFEALEALGSRQPGLRVVMAMYEENARKVSSLLKLVNPGERPEVIPLGTLQAMLRLRECLDEGAFVGFLGDRPLGHEPCHRVSFLGHSAGFPVGPMRAAALLQRKVIFMAGIYRGANRYHIVFEEVADFAGTTAAERDVAVRSAIERYAALLEQHCRHDPYNWFNFYDFWRES